MKLSKHPYNIAAHVTALLCLFVILLAGCGNKDTNIVITANDIEHTADYAWQESNTKFPFTGNMSITSKEYSLDKGKYKMQIKGFGSPGENRLPRFVIEFGQYEVKMLNVDLQTSTYDVNFELPEDTKGKFVFTFNDDYNSPTEDRNVFIFFPVLVKKY